MDERTSRKTLPQGVRIRNGAIQISFERNKKSYNITLPHPPTAEGISTASKIRSELITKAEWGILTDIDIAKAKGVQIEENTVIVGGGVLFQEVAQQYLRHCEANLDTKQDYRSALQKHWMPDLALVPIHEITTAMIKDIIIDREFKTAKTLNNCLVPLRGVFQTAVQERFISSNPLDVIKNKKIQVDDPDPFTRDEMNALLNWLDINLIDDNHFYYLYYELAFWTGCRPSELIALRWDDIDWFNNTLRINKSRVRGVEKSVTKTHTARTVYLNDRSRRALDTLKQIIPSIAKTEFEDYVLVCPETKEAFFNEKPPRLRLVEAMKGCNIRHRPAYNARHTYATMLLMDGVNPVFVANQLGHSLQMLMKRYGKWIHGDKNRLEMAKLNTNS